MVLPLVNALALFAAGYLLGESQPKQAPKSDDYEPPYTPPFQGGQCNTSYNFSGLWSFPTIGNGTRVAFPFNFAGTNGAIGGISAQPIVLNGNSYSFQYTVIFGGVSQTYTSSAGSVFDGQSQPVVGSVPSPVEIVVSRRDGQPDNCGNLPNPNGSLPSNSSGLASDGFDPDAEPNTELAAPLVPFLPSFLAALNAALAAAAAAANALDGIKAVADAIAAIADLLKKIREDLNEKEKEKDKNKEVLSYRFGEIEKDGFLRLYPSDSFADCEAFQLDILVKSIPIGYGKYFGRFSPNYFEYKRLGHIAFVSGSFGIIERKFIEFGRSSFSIPKGSVGFYYHLGLDGIIKADASAIYLREVEQIE